MQLKDWSAREVRLRLRSTDGLRLRTGPFVFNIRSEVDEVHEGIALHYGGHDVMPDADSTFCDFHVQVCRPPGLRRYVRPQVIFRLDGQRPFEPLPGDQGYPVLEWGMNWSASFNAHQYVIMHAAVLERGGRALVMPAPSGSGKSTLCAALAWRGWRLLSDELALLEPATGLLWALARPVSLKNHSIDVIRAWEPGAVMNRPVHETIKGMVAHMSPPAEAVQRVREPALPGWLVLPQFEAGSPTQLQPLGRARAFLELHKSTFNYHLHGRVGFQALGDMVARSHCYTFRYSRLQEAMQAFDELPPAPT